MNDQLQKPVKEVKIGGSIEHASILRKFTILFLLMSIIPMLLLYYFYIQIKTKGAISLSVAQFNVTLLFVVSGVFVGFLAMRSVLIKLLKLSEANRKVLERMLTPERVSNLSREKNEIAVLAQSFTEITTRLEENVKSLQLAKKTLQSVMEKIGDGISNMENINTFLELILETVVEAMSCKTAVLMTFNKRRTHAQVKAVYGVNFPIEEADPIEIMPHTVIDQVLQSKETVIIEQVPKNILDSKRHDVLFQSPLICIPMIFKDKVNGVIAVSGGRKDVLFDEHEITLLKNLSYQTAIAIENAKLNNDIEKTYFETISALALAVDAKDKYSRGHLDRVAKYCVMIAKRLGLDDQDVKILRDAARLHDIGKIGIPDEVLKKQDQLSDQEFEMMKTHTQIGESIIKPIRSLNHLCDIIRHHHEKLNGRGYPDGLKGDEISPLVRITTVADIYDALTTDRPYRNAFTREQACEMLKGMKEEVDQEIVTVLIEALGN